MMKAPSARAIAAVFAACFVFLGVASVEQARGETRPVVTIDAAKTGEPISKYIYGQFIEQLGRCIYGGIWAEMLEDRKFYYPVTDEYRPYPVDDRGKKQGGEFPIVTGSPWKVLGGPGCVKMTAENPYVGEHTPQVELSGGPTARGIEQLDLALEENREYTGRIVLAGSPQAAPIEVRLAWGSGEGERDTTTIRQIGGDFAKHALRFKAGATTDGGRLQIVGLGTGSFRIGAVSLMPADNVKGMRADTLELLKDLNAPVYRWPGGNFVSGYNWRDGVGDIDRRPPRKNPAWTGIEHNDFGIDEFVAFCREVDTEPMIAVNSGFGDDHSAAQEVEYTNGSTETPMGKWRAANGHPEPYELRLWCIGNEMYGKWQLGYMSLKHYTIKHNLFARAMRKVDPSMKLVAVGRRGEWTQGMLERCADHMDLISEHFYKREKKESVVEHVRQPVDSTRRIVTAHRDYRKQLDSLKGKDIRIAIDEWNYWYGPHIYGELGVRYFHKDALGVAAGLHEMIRNSDMVFMANYAQTVNVIGCIKTTRTEAAFATTGLPLMLYRRRFGVLPVQVSGVPEPLDVVAAWTDDREALTIAIVNPTEKKQELELSLKNAKLLDDGDVWWIQNSDPMAYNQPGKDPAVEIEVKEVGAISNTLRAEPLSITLYRLGARRGG